MNCIQMCYLRTNMSKFPVRAAIRDAIAEEMRLDPNVFLIGEEVGEYEGAYKVSQGLISEFGAVSYTHLTLPTRAVV